MPTRFISLLIVVAWSAAVWFWLDPRPMASPSPIPTQSLAWADFFERHLLLTLPVAKFFQPPLRPPTAIGVRVARPFAVEGHLGEDWNVARGDNDLGEPVYSPAEGWVSLAEDFQAAWGKVVLICYRTRPGSQSAAVEMMFAHLETIEVKPGDFVYQGQRIGSLGNADGVYKAHLHWEIRTVIGLGLGGGYDDHTTGWLAPSDFLRTYGDSRFPDLATEQIPPKEWESWGSD